MDCIFNYHFVLRTECFRARRFSFYVIFPITTWIIHTNVETGARKHPSAKHNVINIKNDKRLDLYYPPKSWLMTLSLAFCFVRGSL